MVLCLSRQGRQITAEIRTVIPSEGTSASVPITTFTASWVAQLLGYPRRYRNSRIVETFTSVAIRSYLLLFPLVPLDLIVKGPLANFSFIWHSLNSAAGQVFTNPVTGALVWDAKGLEENVGGFDKIKETLA